MGLHTINNNDAEKRDHQEGFEERIISEAESRNIANYLEVTHDRKKVNAI